MGANRKEAKEMIVTLKELFSVDELNWWLAVARFTIYRCHKPKSFVKILFHILRSLPINYIGFGMTLD
jgi:hypothetical protein